MIFTPGEIADMVLMTAIIGFLFKDSVRIPSPSKDILERYTKPVATHWDDFLWACMLIGPSILLHELSHKFVAMSFGLNAVFHAACSVSTLGNGFFSSYCLIQLVAVLMKLVGWGFVIFVPGFVSMSGITTPVQNILISFAGPAVHLIFWLGSAWLLRDKKRVRKYSHKKRVFLFFTKQINMMLFILNMIPIPGFDGWRVAADIVRLVVGS
jgi:Zn-dependent protease